MTQDTEFKKLITELGTRALQLPDPFEKGWGLPLDSAAAGDVVRYVSSQGFHNLLAGIRTASERVRDAKNHYRRQDNMLVAGMLYGHDVIGIFANMLSLNQLFRSRPDRLHNADLLADCVNFAYFSKIFGSTVMYLASDGDTQFVFNIPFSALDYLFNTSVKGQKKATVYAALQGSLHSPDYIALHQLVNNVSTDCEITIYDDTAYRMAWVRDYGHGIRDEKGDPLPPERFGDLFSGFSTKGDGHGNGLQIVNRLMRLRGGSVDVTTATDKTITYSTADGSCHAQPLVQYRGTRVTLYIPASALK